MKTLFIAISLFGLFCSGFSQNYYPIQPELYNYMFNTGSYWIYEEENTGLLDTVTVTSIVEDLYVPYPGLQPSQIFRMHYTSTHVQKCLSHNFLGILIYKCGSPLNSMFFDSRIIGDNSGEITVLDTANTFQLGSLTFPTVTKFEWLPDPSVAPYYYFWSRNVGLIRKEVDSTYTGNNYEIWNLIDYNLVPVYIDIDENEKRWIDISPNPVHDNLYIQRATSSGELVQIKLFDINGRLIREEESQETQHTIDLSDLSPGIYVLEVTSVDQVHREKIVKH